MTILSAKASHEKTDKAILDKMDERMNMIMCKIDEACKSCRYNVTVEDYTLDTDMVHELRKVGYIVNYNQMDGCYIIEW
jgi:hypothetical protein